jgi:hypothetical protein
MEEMNKKMTDAHAGVSKNIESRNENLAFIKQKELDKMNFRDLVLFLDKTAKFQVEQKCNHKMCLIRVNSPMN